MVHLRQKTTANGNVSLYLDYYQYGKRKREYLGITYEAKSKDAKTLIKKAEAIRIEREYQLLHQNTSTQNPDLYNRSFNKYWQAVTDSITRKDKRMFRAAERAFTKHMGHYPFRSLDIKLMQRWANWLLQNMNGVTPTNYFKVTRNVIKQAVGQGYIKENPAAEVVMRNPRSKRYSKEVLWPEEIKKLIAAPCTNAEVKRAFLFSTQTALRPVDIYTLDWSLLRLSPVGNYMDIEQSKTGERVTIFLNKYAMSLLGPIQKKGKMFKLPTLNGCNKAIKKWVLDAGINKHITFYCARHSAITNVLHATGNIKIASGFAGHTTTQQTERYSHIVNDHLKKAADAISID